MKDKEEIRAASPVDIEEGTSEQKHEETEQVKELQRGLKPRHANMFAITGSLGTGLIIGMGKSLAVGGPGSLFLAYVIMGNTVYFVLAALAEMAVFAPHKKGFSGYATRYMDPALGDDINVGVWIAVFGVCIVGLNFMKVQWFREAEFWMASMKVIIILVLIFTCFVISLGGSPSGECIGFRYWSDPGSFFQYKFTGSTGYFGGFWSCFIQAAFMYMGLESVAITFGEAKNSRKTIPRALKQTIWKLLPLRGLLLVLHHRAVLITSGWEVFTPVFDPRRFVVACVGVFAWIVMILGWKFYKGTKMVQPLTMDLQTGVRDYVLEPEDEEVKQTFVARELIDRDILLFNDTNAAYLIIRPGISVVAEWLSTNHRASGYGAKMRVAGSMLEDFLTFPASLDILGKGRRSMVLKIDEYLINPSLVEADLSYIKQTFDRVHCFCTMPHLQENGSVLGDQNMLPNEAPAHVSGLPVWQSGFPYQKADWLPTETKLPQSLASGVTYNDTVTKIDSSGSMPQTCDTTSSRAFISERSIDQARRLKMIYIGAGISGIVGCIEFLKKALTLNLVIYEKNPEVGGAWFENRYPGCACDIPSHSYQLSFESWTRWEKVFAGSGEILEYWKRVADKYNVRDKVQFEKKCIGAHWSETSSKWIVHVKDLKTGVCFQDDCDVLMTGEGVLNEWKWPDITGIETFKGKLLHSANWDTDYDVEGKAVAVIGAGNSGIQIVPALEPKVKYMDHYVRRRTWISNGHGAQEIKERTQGTGGNFAYTEEEKDQWENDQQDAARENFTADMESRLQNKPNITSHLIPTFPPLCKRLTPGPGYLEALTSLKVNVIPTAISHIDGTGIMTYDGVHHTVDAIVCATGFLTSAGTRGFPIIGRDGTNLRERYLQRSETYLGLATDNFPNFFQSLGPNAFQGAGNLLIIIEAIHHYVGQIIEKMAYGNVGIVEQKPESVQVFTNHCEEYFKRTVYVEECDSWYKSSPPGTTREERRRGRVTAIWPGSSLHAINALKKVRWEDFVTKPYDGNTFGWFGNGSTVAEKNPKREEIDSFSWYLNKTNILKD
ncbi:hypothetical protein FSARC_7387 [Fusarium sarcochroum]|uniref:Amino acid permease/ SLC12A domain-containing protein n=1 Tax=Fusarium sarcochroum TaxID=1208366 RepID=A0A8H4TV54_9HYPO|nr:hypothetical protein FSARC_7387 [Fusarium sarcochroum]